MPTLRILVVLFAIAAITPFAGLAAVPGEIAPAAPADEGREALAVGADNGCSASAGTSFLTEAPAWSERYVVCPNNDCSEPCLPECQQQSDCSQVCAPCEPPFTNGWICANEYGCDSYCECFCGRL